MLERKSGGMIRIYVCWPQGAYFGYEGLWMIPTLLTGPGRRDREAKRNFD